MRVTYSGAAPKQTTYGNPLTGIHVWGAGEELKFKKKDSRTGSQLGRKQSLVTTLELRLCWDTSEGDKLLWCLASGRTGLGENTWEQGHWPKFEPRGYTTPSSTLATLCPGRYVPKPPAVQSYNLLVYRSGSKSHRIKTQV